MASRPGKTLDFKNKILAVGGLEPTARESGSISLTGARTLAADTPVAITGATVLTLQDSGGIFSVSQAAAYDIDLPNPTEGPGLSYLFYVTAPGANDVTISVALGATFVGNIIDDTSVVVATGNTLTIASGTAMLGDSIEVTSISTSLYLVRAVSSAADGITATTEEPEP